VAKEVWNACATVLGVKEPWLRKPDVVQTDHGKLLWDRPILTVEELRAHRPDLFFVDAKAKRVYIIEIAVAADQHVLEKAIEKMEKYSGLAREVARMYKRYEVSVVPIVVGNLGETCALEEWLPSLSFVEDAVVRRKLLSNIQRVVLIANVRLLKAHLAKKRPFQ
jgi:DNA polymerase III epsilon subunit-like protein